MLLPLTVPPSTVTYIEAEPPYSNETPAENVTLDFTVLTVTFKVALIGL